ncbi:MAG: FliH/SctL family protein [Polyangiaceae bacterium]
MSVLHAGRILRASDVEGTYVVLPVAPDGDVSRGAARRVPAEVAAAVVEARTIVDVANERAARILDDAESRAVAIASDARERGRAEGEATLADAWLVLRRREASLDAAVEERIVGTSTVLAERIVGASLEREAGRIVTLARRAMDEIRGARSCVVEAHPLDIPALREHLSLLGAEGMALDVRENEDISRGDLVLHTDLGTTDARLRTQLARLGRTLGNSR